MASSLPSLQVSKGSAVNEFLGWLIEIMAEVGTRSSMTSNHGRTRVGTRTTTTCTYVRATYIHRRHNNYVAFSHISLLTSLLLLYIPSYVTISLTPFYTTHAPCPPQQQLPSGNNKIIQSLTPCIYIYIYIYMHGLTRINANST